jgi:hypothetical protein
MLYNSMYRFIRYTALNLLFFLSSIVAIHSQENLSWEVLSDVEWAEKYDSTSATSLLTATFGSSSMAYNNKEVYITGYVIPLDALGISFALSRNSYASCFFCGQAGPETVMDLMVKPGTIPKTKYNNYPLKFKGTLILKEVNPTGFNYQLVNALLISG